VAQKPAWLLEQTGFEPPRPVIASSCSGCQVHSILGLEETLDLRWRALQSLRGRLAAESFSTNRTNGSEKQCAAPAHAAPVLAASEAFRLKKPCHKPTAATTQAPTTAHTGLLATTIHCFAPKLRALLRRELLPQERDGTLWDQARRRDVAPP
jgi:hypothetical protein